MRALLICAESISWRLLLPRLSFAIFHYFDTDSLRYFTRRRERRCRAIRAFVICARHVGF